MVKVSYLVRLKAAHILQSIACQSSIKRLYFRTSGLQSRNEQLFHLFQEDGLSPREQELKDLKESLQDTQPVGVLVDCCRTMDQVQPLLCKYHDDVPQKVFPETSHILNN